MAADTLEALRDRIASLQVIRCRMVHERVRVENGSVLRVSRGEPEPGLVRMGLCGPEARARNLACGHTMARYALLDAIKTLHAAGWLPATERAALQEEVESVSNAIHLLDHRKGEAEKTLALLSEKKHCSCEESAAEVRCLEERHGAYAERLRALQATVLAHLDAAVRNGTGIAGGASAPRA